MSPCLLLFESHMSKETGRHFGSSSETFSFESKTQKRFGGRSKRFPHRHAPTAPPLVGVQKTKGNAGLVRVTSSKDRRAAIATRFLDFSLSPPGGEGKNSQFLSLPPARPPPRTPHPSTLHSPLSTLSCVVCCALLSSMRQLHCRLFVRQIHFKLPTSMIMT